MSMTTPSQQAIMDTIDNLLILPARATHTQAYAQERLRALTGGDPAALDFLDSQGRSPLMAAARPDKALIANLWNSGQSRQVEQNTKTTVRALIREGANPLFDLATTTSLFNALPVEEASWLVRVEAQAEAGGRLRRAADGSHLLHWLGRHNQNTLSMVLNKAGWNLSGLDEQARAWLTEPHPTHGRTIVQDLAWQAVHSKRKEGLRPGSVQVILQIMAFVMNGTASGVSAMLDPDPEGNSAWAMMNSACEAGQIVADNLFNGPLWTAVRAEAEARQLEGATAAAGAGARGPRL